MADVVLLWHFHQPSYVDAVTGEVLMPWVRLHTVRGYADMAEMARRHAKVKMNFNLTPVLVQQIEQMADGRVKDRWGDLASKPAKELNENEKGELLEHFFKINWHTCIDPHPRYRQLLDLRGRRAGSAHNLKRFKEADLRDLQVWFNLGWCGFAVRQRYPELNELIRKGRDFTEEEKRRVLAIHQEMLKGILGEYRALADSGQVELTTTPFYHPILPLLADTDAAKRAMPWARLPDRLQAPEDALAHLQRAQESHTRVFGRKARGLWPSEGSVSPEVIPLMAKAGFEYFCTDEAVLFRGLEEQGRKVDHVELFQAWRVEEQGATLKALFRERPLSDYIGFTAARTEPKAAADYLLVHLEHIAHVMPKGGVVTLALDGENAWEAFPDSGESFLHEFYSRLGHSGRIRTQTLGGYLDGKEGALAGRIHSGSWIGGNFDIWIGDPEENRAWDWIRRTREFLKQAESRNHLPEETKKAAWEDLYAAEGSDWFWWYGPDFQTDSDLIFDALFRTRLQNVYRRLGATPPPALSVPICAAEVRLGHPPLRSIEPKLGPRPSYLDWSGAGKYDAWRDQGAMAQGDRRVRTILYGFGEKYFYFRIDGKPPLGDEVSIDFNQPAHVKVRAVPQNGHWSVEVSRAKDGIHFEPVPAEAEVAGERGLQLRVPFANLGWRNDGAEVSCLVRVVRGGMEAERYPERGLIEFAGPNKTHDMKNVNLVLCLHMHQPLGNFPSVVDQIVKETYRPVLEVLRKHPGISVNLHLSGVLLEMLAEWHADLLAQLRELVATGRVEMMTGGFYEPVLVEWAEDDRDGQLAMMAGWLKSRLGAEPAGAWLAEGVWGPSLCSSFNRAGIQYAAIDGSFFLQAGISPAKLNGHYVTDQAGDLLTVFPTCPDLARLIPHAPWDDLLGHLRRIANRGEDITLTLTANLETWPSLNGGPAAYLDTLFTKIEESANWIQTLTGRTQIKRQAAKGRVALPPGTPAELGGWSLPGAARREFFRERAQLGQRYDSAKVLPFFRGGSWASFRVRYSEVNLVYRKNLMLGRKLRAKGKTAKSRSIQEKLWRAQCSTAQWHGTKGGLHLPHLREAIWKELLSAEAELREGQAETELLREDFDADGQLEISAAHPALSLMVAPHQGGCCLELGFPKLGRNLGNVLTRRDEGTNSAPPPVTDWYDRNIFQDHFFARGTTVEQLSNGTYPELGDFILQPFQLRQMRQTGSRVTIELFRDGGLYRMGLRQPCQLDKVFAIDAASGVVEVSYQLTNTGTLPLEAVFATELNLNLGPDQGGRGSIKAGSLQKTDRESWQTSDIKGLTARSVDGMEIRVMTDNLPLAWGYPLLDVEAGPEGPIRQGNAFLLGQHLDLKPKEKAEFRIKLSFAKG